MSEVTWNWPRCPRCDAGMAADQPKYGFYEYNCSSTIDFDNRMTVSYHCLKRQLDQRDKRIANLEHSAVTATKLADEVLREIISVLLPDVKTTINGEVDK